MNERELEEEAERLGWTVKYLKSHLAKEERIEKVFNRLEDEKIVKKFKKKYGKEWDQLGEEIN